MLEISGWSRAIKCTFILAATFAYFFVFLGHSFEVSSTSINPGEEAILTGTASPESRLTFNSGFTMSLPVTDGEYQYEATVEIPQKPNRFTVTARNVQDFNAGVKFGIWVTKSFNASGGTARISQRDVPPGRYRLKMFGKALPGSLEVPVTVEAETQVQADSSGKYKLVIDTSGIPAGDYRIEGAGDTKTIRIGGGGSSEVSISSEKREFADGRSGSGKVSSGGTSKPVQIDRRAIQWYASKVGLNAGNSTQYEEAESLLKKRLSGDYWRLIARGDPLTEEAGDCQHEFCLVRGIDACTVCREKAVIAASKESPPKNQPGIDLTVPSLLPSNQSPSGANKPGRGDGLLSMLMDWVLRLLGLGTGG